MNADQAMETEPPEQAPAATPTHGIYVSTDVPARSLILTDACGDTHTYGMLLYEKVNDDINRQVVIFTLDLRTKVQGRICGEARNLPPADWAALLADPAAYLHRWLKLYHRQVHGYPPK